MNLFLNKSLNVFSDFSCLYLQIGNNDLLKISGKDRHLIEEIIDLFKNENSASQIFDNLAVKGKVSKSNFNQIINFLQKNSILQEKKEENLSNVQSIKNLNIVLVGNFNDSILAKNDINNLLVKNPKLKIEAINIFNSDYDCDQLIKHCEKDVNFILFFSPFIRDIETIRKLSLFLFKKNIPTILIGLEKNGFSIGPIISPEIETPSLECYIRRKYSSLQNPDQFLASLSTLRGNNTHYNDVCSNQYYKIMLAFLSLELESFLSNGYSALVGKEAIFDCEKYNLVSSKVLKTLFHPKYNTGTLQLFNV